jgi:Xaa-Pro aminopeptidase
LAAVEPDLLDEEEKKWLNQYHERVYNTLGPLLDEKERLWLKDKTRAI